MRVTKKLLQASLELSRKTVSRLDRDLTTAIDQYGKLQRENAWHKHLIDRLVSKR